MHALPATFLLLAVALLLPEVQAGTPDAPEVKDSADDGGLDHLDIQSVWVDTDALLNLTFHVRLGADLPTPPRPTSHCVEGSCAMASLTYQVVFRVVGPDGAPLPALPDYNRSVVTYRHGPNGTLAAAVGMYDHDDAPTFNGTANVTVAGGDVVLRIPRDNPAVRMPTGARPGTRIDQMFAHDQPQACVPAPGFAAPCVPVLKPAVNMTPGVNSLTAKPDWDRAPDVGYANATFPAPQATPKLVAKSTTSAKPAPPPEPQPAPPVPAPAAAEPEPVAPASEEAAATGRAKDAPAPPPLALLALLGLVAWRQRRRA